MKDIGWPEFMTEDDWAEIFETEEEFTMNDISVWNWIRSCWNTWQVWRSLDQEQRAWITTPFDPEDSEEIKHDPIMAFVALWLALLLDRRESANR